MIKKQLTKEGKVVAEISIKKMTREEHIKSGFMFSDIFSYLNMKEFLSIEKDYVYYIDYIYVEPEYRKKKYGSIIISRSLDAVKKEDSNISNVVVLTKSSVLTREFADQPDKITYNRIMNRNALFFEKNHFISVNEIIGQYESSEVFMLNNVACKNFMKGYNSYKNRIGETKNEQHNEQS